MFHIYNNVIRVSGAMGQIPSLKHNHSFGRGPDEGKICLKLYIKLLPYHSWHLYNSWVAFWQKIDQIVIQKISDGI